MHRGGLNRGTREVQHAQEKQEKKGSYQENNIE
jgi:hypothetical protein